MSERRALPSREPQYSEADVAEMRQNWERAQADRDRNNQYARLEGQVTNLTTQLPELVKAQVRIVLAEEKQRDDDKRQSDLRQLLAFLGVIVVLVVPLENLLVNVIRTGHP